jgi:hypothetical protein
MNPEQAWQSVLGQLQMEMPRASFDTWVRDTRVVSYAEGSMTIGVNNAYARDWLDFSPWQHSLPPADGDDGSSGRRGLRGLLGLGYR